MNNQRFSRYALGALVLTSVVISNAYKNSNVYKVVLRKKRQEYSSIYQLQDQTFSLLDRLGRIQSYIGTCENSDLLEWDTTIDKYFLATEKGCVAAYAYSETVFPDSEQGVLQNIDITAREMVSLLPQAVHLLHLSFNKYFARNHTLDLESIYHELEEKSIFETLTHCNKTAFMLPKYEVPRYKSILSKEPYLIENKNTLFHHFRLTFTVFQAFQSRQNVPIIPFSLYIFVHR